MMDATANWLLQYASAHLLASLLIVPVTCVALRLRAIAPERRAGLLSLAFALLIVGPAIALQTGGLFATMSNAGVPVEAAAPGLGAMPVLPAQVVAQDGIGIAPALAALLLVAWLAGASWQIARLLAAHVGLRRIVASSRRSRSALIPRTSIFAPRLNNWTRSSPSACQKSSTRARIGLAVVAASPTRSAASTSRSGTFSASRSASLFGACSAARCVTICAPTRISASAT